jgi:serine/threonine-protein kinase
MLEGSQLGMSIKPSWEQWVGQVVNGKFPLQRFLGRSENSGVFLTERPGLASEKAAIKLVAGDGNREYKTRWAQASTLSHPNLLQIYEAGSTQLAGKPFSYVVMEYAEENLAEIPSDRKLSTAEASALLAPVLDALSYLHGQGLVHSHVKPSNILAVEEQIKLSTDSIRPAGAATDSSLASSDFDPPEISSGLAGAPGDVWSLGKVLQQTTGVEFPAANNGGPAPSLAADPFLMLLNHCLQRQPPRRWTVPRIAAWLRDNSLSAASISSPAEPRPTSSSVGSGPQTRWLLGAAIAVVVLVVGMLVFKRGDSSEGTSSQGPSTSSSQTPPAAERTAAPSSVPPVAKTAEPEANAPEANAPEANTRGSVEKRVLPAVSPGARRTIQGHVRVGVRVNVDASGNVTRVWLASPGPSQNFARLARTAAHDWKFTSPRVHGQPVESVWSLKFAFGRTSTEVVPTQTKP